MEFKGTKGKWVVELNDNDPFYKRNVLEVGLKGNYPVAVLYGDGNYFNNETKSNALLISKAPEMLEMLNKCKDAMLELMEHQDGWEDDYEELKKLIKEATEIN